MHNKIEQFKYTLITNGNIVNEKLTQLAKK